jgi:GNAT superfamily N-acetyltransferase
LKITEATTAKQLAQFDELVAEFKKWDSAMSREIGLDVEAMLDFLYTQPPAELGSKQRVFLATDEGRIGGCGALKMLSEEIAELTRVYVRPDFRGKGIGRAIVERILATAREQGYKTICLETAIFMTEAHALYRSFGFRERPPFRQVPDSLKHAELFMELSLADPPRPRSTVRRP